MKSIRIIAIASGVTLAGLLSACASVPDTSSAPAVAAPAAAASALPSPDTQFLSDVNAEDAGISSAAGGDGNLLLLAGGVCSDWEGGDNAAGVVNDAITGLGEQTSTTISATQIGEIIGVATSDICPAYESTLQAYLVANGDA